MKYNEQHAITMLNALQYTETLKEHDKEIRKKAIDEFYNLLFARLFSLPRASTIYKELGFNYLYF